MAHCITPALMESTYTMLLATQPFKSWGLPHADAVEFSVRPFRRKVHVAYYEFPTKRTARRQFRRIALNSKHVWHTSALLTVMAHEMCHLKEDIDGNIGKEVHGPKFMKLARKVCRVHGFKITEFYI